MLTPPMSNPKNLLWLVANRASGSNDDDTLSAVISALTDSGYAPAKVVDCAADPLPTRADLEAARVGVLAVFTGDGTLSAVVPPLEGWAGHVLVLPGGTSNLLVEICHGPDNAIGDDFSSNNAIVQQTIDFPYQVSLTYRANDVSNACNSPLISNTQETRRPRLWL